jgi:putative FmdB family regulatory protein
LALEGAECQSPFHKLRDVLTDTAEDRVPTYQYACTECGHFFEQFQSFTDDALTECPVCSGKLRKVFNAVGVVFKGSGFYRNDSRAPSSEKSEGGPKEKSASTTEKSSSGEKSSSTTSSSAAAAS